MKLIIERKIFKCVFFTGLFLLCSGCLLAQKYVDYTSNKFCFGFKFGLGLSGFNGGIYPGGSALPVVVFDPGVSFLIPITKYRLSMQTEITYNWRLFDGDDIEDDALLRINTLEIPLMFNLRIFEYEGIYNRKAVNFLAGIGYARGLISRLMTPVNDGYVYTNQDGHIITLYDSSKFVDVRKNNLFYVIGINTRILGGAHKTVGLRYTRFLKSMYGLDQKIEDFDFTVKAYGLSLEISAYF